MPSGVISQARTCRHCETQFTAINVSQHCCSRICAILTRTKIDKNGCIIWLGGIISDGYGCIKIDRKMQLVHRIMWEHKHGPVPDGKLVLHHCDVRRCINDKHLYVGTHADNMADMVARQRFHSKLTSKDVARIKEMNLSQAKIARIFGVAQSTIHRIKLEKSWKQAGNHDDVG